MATTIENTGPGRFRVASDQVMTFQEFVDDCMAQAEENGYADAIANESANWNILLIGGASAELKAAYEKGHRRGSCYRIGYYDALDWVTTKLDGWTPEDLAVYREGWNAGYAERCERANAKRAQVAPSVEFVSPEQNAAEVAQAKAEGRHLGSFTIKV